MKKLSKILFISVAVILFYSVMFSANAAETIRFNAGNVSTKNNRIFSIPVSGNGNESLSAVKFVFEYDTNAIEFRKINVTDKNSIVKEVEENGKLSLIFLNEKGVNLSNSQQLFTVSFKAENMSKNQEINFSVSDCVNSKVQSVNATGGKCIVTYLGNAPDDEEDSNGSSSGKTGNTSKTTGKTSSNGNTSNSNSKYEEFENSDEYDDYQEYGDQENINSQNDNDNQYDEDGNILKVNEKDNTLKVFLSGALIVLVLVVIGGVLYHLGRKSKERENKNEKEDDQEENNTEQENSNEE